MESKGHGLLDTSLARGMTALAGEALCPTYLKTPYTRHRSQNNRVWYDDALLIRYTAIPPKSEGSPNRRIGIRGITAPTNFSLAMIPAVLSLFLQPGQAA